MLVTIRNPDRATARTVFASEAMEVGMIVKMVQGTALGEPCQVAKVTTKADLQDASIVKGIVTYIPDNDLAVDFIIDPTNEALSKNTGDDNTYVIPAGKPVVVWFNRPVVGFHQFSVDAALTVASTREGTKVAFDTDSSKLTLHNAGDATRDVCLGTVYQNEDGAEITVIFHGL